MRRLMSLLPLVLLTGCATYRDLASEPLRMSQDIAAFEETDKVSAPPEAAVLLSGSSTLRLWKTAAEDFAPMPVLNRGFGGSYTTEVLGYMDRITLPYRPRVILFHCGHNDVFFGDRADRVAARVEEYCLAARARDPRVRVVIAGITKAPSRRAKWTEMDRTNRLLDELAARHDWIDFVDVNPALNLPDGEPREGMYLKDALHPSPAGYAALRAALRPAVEAAWRGRSPVQ
ncbi:MAG: GDSL-type esterase/lipase family protein [Opitutales bacterium]